jgi:hypothetical protein
VTDSPLAAASVPPASAQKQQGKSKATTGSAVPPDKVKLEASNAGISDSSSQTTASHVSGMLPGQETPACQEGGQDAESPTRSAPPPWQRPDWDRTENLQVLSVYLTSTRVKAPAYPLTLSSVPRRIRRPPGVFVLQHKFKKWVYWGTAWDLFEAQREQLELVRMNIHPDPPHEQPPGPRARRVRGREGGAHAHDPSSSMTSRPSSRRS